MNSNKINTDAIPISLTSMDISLIYFMRKKILKPKDVGEFFECIKILDGDKEVLEEISKHTPNISMSIYDLYINKEPKQLEIIINNI